MLAPVLKSAGYDVVACEGAPVALAKLEAGERFDVVISDIEMPEMDGYQFAQALRGNPRFAQLPIIALSSHASPAAIARGHEAGFHDYVAKFDRAGLLTTLQETARTMGVAA